MKTLLPYLLTTVICICVAVTDLVSQTQTNFTTDSIFLKTAVKSDDNRQNTISNKSEEVLFTEHVILQNLNGANTIAGADFEGDGDVDVIATSFGGGYISWFENDGNQNFSSHLLIENFGQPKVDVAYIDGDLDYDIIASSQSGDKISWFENNGEADFVEHVIIDNWESAGFVYAKDQLRGIDLDINEDGYTDFIATATSPGNRISWFENDGNQNFTEHLIKENWYWVRRASAYDIDGDSDMDIVAAAKVGEIIWFENDGNENFTEHIVISDWGEPNAVLAEDINQDGYIDLVATSVVANEVAWFENDGNQNFVKHLVKEQYNGGYGLDILDIDNDGDFDVLATAWIGGFGSVFENDGNQNFMEHIFCNSGYDLLHLFSIDLDSDNDRDILGACYGNNLPQIRWWENSFYDINFSANKYRGITPLAIDFKNLSNTTPPITSWAWDFNNDGVFDSYEENPEWIYESTGHYSVRLQVTNDSLTDEIVKENYIHVFNGEKTSLQFDGEKSYVDIPAGDVLNLIETLTIEAWINPFEWGPRVNGEGRLFYKNTFYIYLMSNPKSDSYSANSIVIILKHSDGSTSEFNTPENSISLYEWQHIGLTYDANTNQTRAYISGVEQNLVPIKEGSGSLMDHSNRNLRLGNNLVRSTGFNGLIDELRLWNIVRTQEQIRNSADYYLKGDESGLVGYWQMNEAEGDSILDLSGNGNTGVISEALWSFGSPVTTDINNSPVHSAIPTEFVLYQNFPNPFNPGTTIRFGLPKEGNVILKIYDVLGKEIKTLVNDEEKRAGFHLAAWDGKNSLNQSVASGIYFYQMRIDNISIVKKLLLMK